MLQNVAHLVERISRVLVGRWVLSLPIPLRILFATTPALLAAVLRTIHCVIAGFCGGEFRIIAAIKTPAVIVRILTRLEFSC